MKIMNSRMPLLLLSLAGVCAAWMAIQTGYARSRALTSTSNYVGARAGSSRARWVWQNPIAQGNTLHGVSFVDGNTGTATGDNGTIIRTTDGGNSWVTGQPLALSGQSSGLPMAVTRGLAKLVERVMACLPFHLLIPTPGMPLARTE